MAPSQIDLKTAEPTGPDLRVSKSSLIGALALPERGALVSIVGGGGKSALLFALGARLPGRVILTTTTRIFAAQIARATASIEIDTGTPPHRLESLMVGAPSGLLLVGRVEGEKALGVDVSLPARWLAQDGVDHVIVEADGSRMRPIKAPADHEPAIASGTTDVVIALGIDALGSSIATAAHRPERVRTLIMSTSDRDSDHLLTEEDIGVLVRHPFGGLKEVPIGARVVVMINKVETGVQEQQARRIAANLLRESRIDRVIAGALEGSRSDLWTLYRRDEN